ncbi:CBO0543 family protein [Paenibacillus flagellatus]|uniref:Uncharacterized protein n=1 Tax=Paenibacillus flagellatus TaxID=2211139 RepID=A0A2V5KG79_9BACL|nr:CBO0543 family protein [Paenibacillus flagellatus]PYI57273.1 hypothetical protein DLM86_02185 [Paenibacillus flagellatus]
MILFPAVAFDANEWFVLISALFVILYALWLPNRFPLFVTGFILLFNIFLGVSVDFTIGVKPLDLYDVNDSPRFEYMDLAIYFISYPPVAYIALHYYDRHKPRGWTLVLFVLGWAALTTGLEWMADKAGTFQYNRWRLEWSFIVYIAVYAINIALLATIRRLLRIPVPGAGKG